MQKEYFVYILSNERNTVLYTGVTNNIVRRIVEHREKRGSLFTRKYNLTKLIYFESFGDVNDAIKREKQIKNYSRKTKDTLVDATNPERKDIVIDLWS